MNTLLTFLLNFSFCTILTLFSGRFQNFKKRCVITLCIIYLHLYHTHFFSILFLYYKKDILCWKKSIRHQLLTVYVEMYHPHFILNSFYLFSERYPFFHLINLHWIFYMVNMQCSSFIFSKNYKSSTSHNFFSSPETLWLGQQPKKI